MTRSELVEDFIPLILDADEQLQSPRHLIILATVSRLWLYYVRKRLYCYPHIYSFGAARSLADTLVKNPSLSSLVKVIALQPKAEIAKIISSEEHNTFGQLLALEGVSRITLGIPLSIKYLKLIEHPEVVQEVHLVGRRFFSRHTVWDEALACKFTSLRKLRLVNTDLHVPLPSIACPFPISHLILENSLLKDGGIVYLLNDAASSICLDITSYTPMDATIRLALSSFSVEHVRYKVRASSHENMFAGLKPHRAESLRSLHLDGQFTTADILATIGSLFRDLEELVVIGRETDVSIEEWKRFIRAGKPLSLRRLGLPWGTNKSRWVAWSEAEMEDIRESCGAMNIVLVNSSLAL